jgi:hypothetical protein
LGGDKSSKSEEMTPGSGPIEGVTGVSARSVRVKISNMSKEERAHWREQALIPGTIPYAGKFVRTHSN